MTRKEWDALGNPPGSFDAVLGMAERNAQAKYVPLDADYEHDPVPVCDRCHQLIVMDDEGDWRHADEEPAA